jgi:hypothetical protein
MAALFIASPSFSEAICPTFAVCIMRANFVASWARRAYAELGIGGSWAVRVQALV